jgi:hypothetical protein
MAINIQDREQSSERAINSKEPPKHAAQEELQDWRSPGGEWQAQVGYSLARGAPSK